MLTKQQLILKSQQRFKNEVHNAYPAESDKIALSNNDDKKFKTFDRITSYPHGANAGRVCKTELLQYLNIKWLMLMIIQIKIEKNMAIWSYISDLPYRLLIVRDQKKKCVIRFNYPSTKNWYNISLCKRSIWGKISIFN